MDVRLTGEVLKVDESLGLVFGFAIVCEKDGTPYYDLQGDHVSESEMLKASLDFMENSQVVDEMHDQDDKGTVVFAFPLASDIAKALKVQTDRTGLLIGIKPNADILAKYKSGEYKGFSIGGTAVRTPVTA